MSDVDVHPAQPPEPAPEGEHQLSPPYPAAQSVAAPVKPRSNYTGRLVAAIVVAVVLATGGGIAIGWDLARIISSHNAAQAQIKTVAPATNPTGTLSLSAIANKVDPAVVDVNTTIQTSSGSGQAAGTGLILTPSGDVLTNNHVVDQSTSITVNIQGRPGSFAADVIGVDPSADIAVIHIENVSGLPTVTLANSSSVRIGDSVVAIGNALGLGGAPRATQGSVTALDQSITASENGSNSEQLSGMIQADTEISPGDSGGALVNSAGQVVGVITAGEVAGFRTNTSTVAYAIPSSTAVGIANRILAGQAGGGVIIGPVGYLGVGVETLDPATAGQLGLSVSSGVIVRSVQTGSPAEKAGIKIGSVITGINATTIDSTATLGNALHLFKPGDQVKVTWVDQTTTHSATVTLTTGPTV
jgi:S1-C subfamily serine protease